MFVAHFVDSLATLAKCTMYTLIMPISEMYTCLSTRFL